MEVEEVPVTSYFEYLAGQTVAAQTTVVASKWIAPFPLNLPPLEQVQPLPRLIWHLCLPIPSFWVLSVLFPR